MNKEATLNNTKRRFGTLGGVFVPNVLTILGIILFLRTGWVVGNAGLTNALIIIVLANAITFITGLSLSAITTNIEVKAGGAYYMISRSLGTEIGGSIGVPLYLSQAVSVAFYLIGFSEAFSVLIPWIPPVITASLMCILFAGIAYHGAQFAIKIQYVILTILGFAILSFFLGKSWIPVTITHKPMYLPGYNFWSVFAIFFPAVTGIMAGAAMSGDLKDPSKSIPKGTLLAIGITFVIYIFTAIHLAKNVPVFLLKNSNSVMIDFSRIPFFVYLGVFAATLSSALASIIGAPRTLRALALDKIVPRALARQLGSETEPRAGVIATFIIAESVILAGNLNLVAPVITMFFLNTYGMTNFAAGFENLIGSPSYRPKFKVNWVVSLLGAFGCYFAMFLINSFATIIAIIISYGIFILLTRRSLNQTWGDVRSGLWFWLSRFSLLRLEEYKWHPKNWKPNIMAFIGNPQNRPYLADFIRWLSKGKSINTLTQLLIGDPHELGGKDGMKAKSLKNLKRFIKEAKLQAFAQSQVADSFESGAIAAAQAHGMGAFRPNVILFGWSESHKGGVTLMKIMNRLYDLNKSVFILKLDHKKIFGSKKTIDIWWGGSGGNGDMMLLIAHLLSLHSEWKGSKIRVISVIDDPDGVDDAKKNIDSLLQKARFQKEAVVLPKETKNQEFKNLVHKYSKNTDLTIIGLGLPSLDEVDDYARKLDDLVLPLSSVLMIKSVETEELI